MCLFWKLTGKQTLYMWYLKDGHPVKTQNPNIHQWGKEDFVTARHPSKSEGLGICLNKVYLDDKEQKPN